MSASNKSNLSRRQALVGIGLAGAAAAAPLSGAIASGVNVDRSAWNDAVAQMQAADAVEAEIGQRMTAAHSVAEAACPRNPEFFSRYDMFCGDNGGRNFERAHRSILRERTAGGKTLTTAEAKQAMLDAYRVVDDFETYQARSEEAYREYHVLEKQHDAVCDDRWNARKAVIATPAPDQAALLFKIELLAAIMIEAAVEDADDMALISADASRLLNGEA